MMRLFFATIMWKTVTTIVGFITHPYNTMQKVVEKHIPMGFIFFPAVLCVLGWMIARYFAWIFLFLVPAIGLWWFLEVWWLTLWGLWQITLLYLYLRFSSVRE